jgi:predicted TIM-barrel fold metal-dependent hydrolase
MTVGTDDRYVVISADCHAGGSIDAYTEYLDPAHREDFAAWRAGYSNPFRDLQGDGRTRNWDSDRRFADLEADGQVAEVVFPNTVPPFFPTGMLVARPPTAADLDRRWAGLRAHNRWLADWCSEHPERRAGVAVVFLNDVDAAVAEARWAAEHGLRGGIMIPAVADDTDIEPLYSRAYDPLWRTCEELGLIVNHHAGSGHPDYGDHAASQFMWAIETEWFAHRPFWQLVMSGVFERFPGLRFVLTEQGCAWLPSSLAMLDGMHLAASSGRMGELKMDPEANLSMPPSEYFRRNVWVGVSFPGPREAAAMRKLGLDRVMWGSDYPHHEGSTPFSRELLRRSFSDWSPGDLDQILNRTAADLYGFDVPALEPRAAMVGPTATELAVPLDRIPRGATSPGFYR